MSLRTSQSYLLVINFSVHEKHSKQFKAQFSTRNVLTFERVICNWQWIQNQWKSSLGYFRTITWKTGIHCKTISAVLQFFNFFHYMHFINFHYTQFWAGSTFTRKDASTLAALYHATHSFPLDHSWYVMDNHLISAVKITILLLLCNCIAHISTTICIL